MGYLQVLNLMVKAYKAARGVMPKGIDLLKLQQKARQKVIDSERKVIQFPKDRITDPFKPRPGKGELPVTIKGQTKNMTPEGIMKMLMSKGKDVKIGQAPKTTKVKEAVDPKLEMQESTRELYKRLTRQNREAIKNFKKRNKDDPTKKANGGRIGFAQGGVQYTPTTASRMQANAQAATKAATQATNSQMVPTAQLRNTFKRPMTPEQFIKANSKPGSQSTPTNLLNKYYNTNYSLVAPAGVLSLAQMDANRAKVLAEQKAQQRAGGLEDPITGKKYISQQEAIDDLGIVVYNQRFAEGGRVIFNTGGGVSNVLGTYLSNPSLQDRYTQQEYEDFFGAGTAQPQTVSSLLQNQVQPTRVATPVIPNIIKPIIPIPQGEGEGGNKTFGRDKGVTADASAIGGYTLNPDGSLFNDADVQEEIDLLNPGGVKGFMSGVGNFYKTISPFLNIKKGFEKAKQFGLDTKARIEEAKALAEEKALQAQRDRLTYSGPAFTNQDGSTISQDFSTPAGLSNYDADVLR